MPAGRPPRHPGRPRRRFTPTISEVAAEAGVGRATAARALGEYGSVSPDMRRRVEDAARRLGYQPNQLARSMSTGITKTLGVVLADIANPFFASVTRGVADEVRAAGIDTLVVNTDEDLVSEQHAVEALIAKQVDGILVASAAGMEQPVPHLHAAVDRGTPVVLLDRAVEGLAADAVLLDNRAAAREIATELVEHGHRRIGLVWGPHRPAVGPDPTTGGSITLPTAWERYLGYRDALEAAGIPVDDALVAPMPSSPATCQSAWSDLLSTADRPTAIVSTESYATLGVLVQLRAQGLRCPDDVSLIGIDDAPWSAVTAPALTVYEQPAYEMGSRSAQLLLERLAGDQSPPTVHRLTGRLVRRESVARPPRP